MFLAYMKNLELSYQNSNAAIKTSVKNYIIKDFEVTESMFTCISYGQN